MRSLPAVVVALLALAAVAPPAVAQRGGRPRVEPLTATAATKQAFADVVRTANACTARVFVGDRQVALGTVVTADGWLVTKASELPPEGEIVCEVAGERLPAALRHEDEGSDLAVLRVAARDLTPANWRDEPPAPGAWVVTPDGGELPCGIGILSTAPYRHSQDRGWLGVQMDRRQDAARVQVVQPESAAEAAGLRPGDEIVAVGDEEIASYARFTAAVGQRKPGDELRLRVQRGEELLQVDVRLRRDRRGPKSDQERIWGPLSEVRAGFATVLQHDTVLTPSQCGGPVVDLDGRVIGVNIARAGRVETLALPPATVRAVVQRGRVPFSQQQQQQQQQKR